MAKERLKQIKGFETPMYLRETLIPKTRLGMQLPERFRKKGINTIEEERIDKEMM
jgi:hypothetical protein